MTKRIRLGGLLLLIGVVGMPASCKNSETKPAVTLKDSTTIVAIKPETKPVTVTDTIAFAAPEYCNCLKQTMGRFDPQVEALILKAVEQPSPLDYLEAEIQKMNDPASQEQAVRDLQTFGNLDAASPCILSVSRKYGVDETSPATLQRLVRALENYPDCRLVTALFKLAYSANVPK